MSLRERLGSRPRPEPAGETETARRLVVGLGNPEDEYGGTRHNIGADIVRALANRLGGGLRSNRKVGAAVADVYDRPGGVPLTLAVPGGYMNNAGGPVRRAMDFYRVPLERVVVVHDDLDLELGVLRLKHGGGTAGHNGLRDIQRRCGGAEFLRVRIGIGRPPGRQDPASYVLRPFSRAERERIDEVVEDAGEAILVLATDGLEAAQNRFHTRER